MYLFEFYWPARKKRIHKFIFDTICTLNYERKQSKHILYGTSGSWRAGGLEGASESNDHKAVSTV